MPPGAELVPAGVAAQSIVHSFSSSFNHLSVWSILIESLLGAGLDLALKSNETFENASQVLA